MKQYAGDLGGGNYTATIIDGTGTRFVVGLAPRSLAAGGYGRHMTIHELAHVIINSSFSTKDYSSMLGLLQRSPSWENCFPSPPDSLDKCVGIDEILAEQFAFLVSPPDFRSTYDVPPLASRGDFLARLKRVGGA